MRKVEKRAVVDALNALGIGPARYSFTASGALVRVLNGSAVREVDLRVKMIGRSESDVLDELRAAVRAEPGFAGTSGAAP